MGTSKARLRFITKQLDPEVSPRLSRAALAGARLLSDALDRREVTSHKDLFAAMVAASDLQEITVSNMIWQWGRVGFVKIYGAYLGRVRGDTRRYVVTAGSPLDIRSTT
jgi:hypothetical protein